MAGDDFQVFDVAPHDFCHAVRHIAVRRSVEPIAAHMILLIDFIGHGIEECIVGHGGMEGIVEHRHLRHVGHQVVNGPNTLQVSGVVNGSQVAEALNALFHFLVYEAAFFKQVAPLHDAMSHGIYLVETLNGSVFLAQQRLENEVHTLFVVGHVVVQNFLFAVGQSEFQESVVKTNALHAALRQHAFIVHVIEFVFDRAAAAVQN